MTKTYDARPPSLAVIFRPGVTLNVRLHWLQSGILTDRFFRSRLNGQDLTVSVDGDTMTVTVPDELTGTLASGARAEWLLEEAIEGDWEPLLVGMWQASNVGSPSRDRTVQVTQGAVEVALTVVAGAGGSGGGGGGAVASVNGQVGVVTLNAASVGAEPSGTVTAHAATSGAGGHLPTGGSNGQVPIRGASGNAVAWGAVNADPAGTAAGAVAAHADDYGAGFHMPTGGLPGQVPTHGTGSTVAWADPSVESVNGEAGAVTLDAAAIPYTPTAPMVATNLQAAVDEAATLGGSVASVNGETGAVSLVAGDVPFTPAGGVSGANVQAAIVSAASAGVATLMWDETAEEWLLRVGDPTTAPLREWWGPIAPVLTTGPYSDLWEEDDIYWDTSTP